MNNSFLRLAVIITSLCFIGFFVQQYLLESRKKELMDRANTLRDEMLEVAKMKKITLKIGTKNLSLDQTVALIKSKYDYRFQERDSSYYSGTYFLHKVKDGRRIMVYTNQNERGFVYDIYKEYKTIIEAAGLTSIEEIYRVFEEGNFVELDKSEYSEED